MSFDVLAQGFHDGEAAPSGGAEARAVLAPNARAEESGDQALVLRLPDGEMDVSVGDDGMTASRIDGVQAWDLLVQAARAATWVLMPAGCPTGLTVESQRAHLPEPLGDDAVLVTTGRELLDVIRSS